MQGGQITAAPITCCFTLPSQLSETLLRNVSIRLCRMLDDGWDIDLMLRFMVNRLESDRFIADFRMLGLGEAVVQISAPVARTPCRLKMHESLSVTESHGLK